MKTPVYLISDESTADWHDYRLEWWMPTPEQKNYKRMEEIRFHYCKREEIDIITLQHDRGKDDCRYSWDVKSENKFIKASFRKPTKVTEQEYNEKRAEILEIYKAYLQKNSL